MTAQWLNGTPEMRRYGGSTIGLTGEDVSGGAFHQEKPHLAKAN
jgi:hypothetical protein